MMTVPQRYYAFGALIVGALAVSVWLERKPAPTVEQAVAHERTAEKVAIAAKVKTVYVKARDSAIAGRAPEKRLRDSVVAQPTDTALVKQFVARTDTLLRLDSTAIAQGDSLIRAQKAVIAAKDTELTIALKPHYAPRLAFQIAGWYDVASGGLSGSAGAGLRVIGGLALVGRLEQKMALGERPSVKLGVAVAF